MTIEIKHEFQSAKGDGPDATFVRPSDWNALHEVVMTGPALMGRTLGGAGAAAEVPLGAGLSFTGGALALGFSELPIGIVMDFVGLVEPAGWLFCFGQQLSRDVYSDLFAIIGTAYGVGDGATTYNIPDCRGRVRAGKDNMGGTAANRVLQTVDGKVLGNVIGTEKHVLVPSQLPGHVHTGTTGNANVGHAHHLAANEVINDGSPTLATNAAIARQNNGGQSYAFQSAGGLATIGLSEVEGMAHTHTFTTGSVGSNEGHMNMQPTIIFNSIIYYGVTS